MCISEDAKYVHFSSKKWRFQVSYRVTHRIHCISKAAQKLIPLDRRSECEGFGVRELAPAFQKRRQAAALQTGGRTRTERPAFSLDRWKPGRESEFVLRLLRLAGHEMP
jgi:hypothetical protein